MQPPLAPMAPLSERLLAAARSGNLPVLQALLRSHPPLVDEAGSLGETPDGCCRQQRLNAGRAAAGGCGVEAL